MSPIADRMRSLTEFGGKSRIDHKKRARWAADDDADRDADRKKRTGGKGAEKDDDNDRALSRTDHGGNDATRAVSLSRKSQRAAKGATQGKVKKGFKMVFGKLVKVGKHVGRAARDMVTSMDEPSVTDRMKALVEGVYSQEDFTDALEDAEAEATKAFLALRDAETMVKKMMKRLPDTGRDDSEGRHFIYDDKRKKALQTLAYLLGSTASKLEGDLGRAFTAAAEK